MSNWPSMTGMTTIKRWNKGGFTLRLFLTDSEKLYYQFKDGREVIFEGRDYKPSPLYAIDSLDSVYGLLSFLCTQEGDTDAEYFRNYTEAQLEWCRSRRCEELGWLVFDWEERNNKH